MPDTPRKSPRLPRTRDIYEVPDTPSPISTKRGLPDPYDVPETTPKPRKKYSRKTPLRLRPADTRRDPSTEEVAGQAAAEDEGTIGAGPGPDFKDEREADPSVQRCAVIIDQFNTHPFEVPDTPRKTRSNMIHNRQTTLKAILHKDTRGDTGQNGRRQKTICEVTEQNIGVDDHSNEETQEDEAEVAGQAAEVESVSNSDSYVPGSPLRMSPRLSRTTRASKQKTFGAFEYRTEPEDIDNGPSADDSAASAASDVPAVSNGSSGAALASKVGESTKRSRPETSPKKLPPKKRLKRTYGKRAALKIEHRMELEDVSEGDPPLAAAQRIEGKTRLASAASGILAVSKAAALASKKNTDTDEIQETSTQSRQKPHRKAPLRPIREDEDAGEATAKEAGDLADKGADPIFEEEHAEDAGTQHDGYAAGDADDATGDADDATDDADGGAAVDAHSDAPLEEKHYEIEFNCTGKYRIKVAGSNLPEWDELPSVQSFSYSSEDISVKDLVIAIVNESNDENIAEVRQIKSSHDNYFVLIFWYYTPQELQKKLGKKSRNKRRTNMNARPLKHSYMKTTHMEVILGTSIKGKLAKKDGNSICPGKIFDYIKRRVVDDSRKEVEWVKAV